MAGSRVNNYSPSTTDLTSVMATIDAERLGYIGASLTNYSTTSVPAIASGSMVEVAGALYSFSTDEPISTTGVASTAAAIWHVRLVPSSSQCTAQFSTTPPTWRTDYQGWYYSTASVDKYLQYITYFDGTNYNYKCAGNRDTHLDPQFVSLYASTTVLWVATTTHQLMSSFDGVYNPFSVYSTATGIFTARQSGIYEMNYNFYSMSTIAYSNILYISLYKNGSTFIRTQSGANNTVLNIFNSGLHIFPLNKNEYVSLYVSLSSVAPTTTVVYNNSVSFKRIM